MNGNSKPHFVSFIKENRTKEEAKALHDQRIRDSREIFEKFEDQFSFRHCHVCGNDDYINIDKFDERYSIVKCNFCSSEYVNPAPSKNALDYYYNNSSCNEIFGKLLRKRARKKNIISNERILALLEIINKLLESNKKIRVLDVGCSSGALIFDLKKQLIEQNLNEHVEIVGIDIDKNAIENSVSEDITLVHASLEQFVLSNPSKFDLVIHFELIEHLFNPFDFVVDIHKILQDNGLMYFHTPNKLGLDNQAIGYNEFRPLAHGIFPPMHLQAFTTQNISHFLLRTNFQVLDIQTPGNFDVDIVRTFLKDNSDPDFVAIKSFQEENLAILQKLLKRLKASSHLSVLAKKV